MILVFGKNGQVGRELKSFNKVITLGRDRVDLLNPTQSSKYIIEYSPKVVINAAAYTDVDKAEEEEKIANTINGDAPTEMAITCKKLNIPLIHLSSEYVFSGQGNLPWKDKDKPSPINAYGKSKLLGEKGVISSGANYIILRTSWIFSAYGNNFLKTILNLSSRRNELDIVSDQIGGPTPAKEVAQACISIASKIQVSPIKSGIYNFSGKPDVSWFGFASEILKLSKNQVSLKPVPSASYPTIAKRPLNSRMNCREIKKEFNIKRPYWVKGVKNILKQIEAS